MTKEERMQVDEIKSEIHKAFTAHRNKYCNEHDKQNGATMKELAKVQLTIGGLGERLDTLGKKLSTDVAASIKNEIDVRLPGKGGFHLLGLAPIVMVGIVVMFGMACYTYHDLEMRKAALTAAPAEIASTTGDHNGND